MHIWQKSNWQMLFLISVFKCGNESLKLKQILLLLTFFFHEQLTDSSISFKALPNLLG